MPDKSESDADRGHLAVEEVLHRFESCEFLPSDFNHHPHLAVSLVYLLRFPEEEALEHMRRGILKFLKHHRIDPKVYHETLTVFWMKRVGAFVAGCATSRPLDELAHELSETCGDSRLVFDYYSRELIESEAARTSLVEPDLRPLDF